jgi:hypothetical protein
MFSALRAGLLYFVITFAAGFALGALRVLVTAPRLGELGAVLLELPFMLALSWWACGVALRHNGVPMRRAPRLAMGTLAFALLMAAEFALAVWGFGQSPAAFVARYAGTAQRLGLAGQIAYAMFPLVRRR